MPTQVSSYTNAVFIYVVLDVTVCVCVCVHVCAHVSIGIDRPSLEPYTPLFKTEEQKAHVGKICRGGAMEGK